MRKYWAIFKISWQKEFEYRLNFLLARLRNIIFLLLSYFLWFTLTARTGRFAGFTAAELMTYILLANLLKSLVFGSQSREIAFEINSGIFSKYLAIPINYFWHNFARELAQRTINILSAMIETGVFVLIFKPELLRPASWASGISFLASIILAVMLYFVLSYLINLLAFWSREAMGPRFLFEWLLEFSSGVYFPLAILSAGFFLVLSCLPFFYVLYFPIAAYLGKLTTAAVWQGFLLQLAWLLLAAAAARFVWRRGLKRYSGEGI